MTEQSPTDQRTQRRERMEQRQREIAEAAQRRTMMNRLKMGALLLVVLLAVGGLVFWVFRETTAPLPGEAVPDEGRGHVADGTPLVHNSYPPASGPHYGTWKEKGGFVDGPLGPGLWMHNLEHGYVIILYKCPPDCTEIKGLLRSLGSKVKNSRFGYPKLVIAQDDKIDTSLALIAWNRRQMLTEYDEGKIQAFYNAFVDRGPEDAP